ncbi:MAG: NADH-quinone oxidoreductase subunit M [Conexivisphaerales archaeon]
MLPLITIMLFLPAAGGLLSYLAGMAKKQYAKYVALAFSVVEVILSLWSYYLVFITPSYQFILQETYTWIPGLINYHVGLDGLGAPLVLIASSLTTLAIFGSFREITEKESSYYALILLFLSATVGVFVSLNLILFYFFWDASLLPMFFFIGIWGGPRRKYAATKFLLFTYGGSVSMLLGFLLLYFLGGSTTFDFVYLLNHPPPYWLQLIVSALTFVGFGVKLPIFPLHTWLPDAHVEAPTPISVLLAGLLLKLGGFGFLRFNLQLFYQVAIHYAWVYIAFGLVTMFYGAIVALRQVDMKRMVALTSINHMGFVIFGAFAGIAVTGSVFFGVEGAVFQMFNHAFAIGLMFTLTGIVKHTFDTRDMTVVKGMRYGMPLASAAVGLGALAAMGAPVFSSFLSEFMVIYSGILYSPWLWFAVLAPGITAAYMLWMLKRMVLSQKAEGLSYHDIDRKFFVYLIAYLVPLVLLLIFPSLILSPVATFAQSLLGGP